MPGPVAIDTSDTKFEQSLPNAKLGSNETPPEQRELQVKAKSKNKKNKKINRTGSSSQSEPVVSAIEAVPVTVERKPFVQTEEEKLQNPYLARANVAASFEKPRGTTENSYASRHRDQTVLQQHIEFFDRDLDGIIWPQDTFIGFYRLGYGVILSLVSVFIIHSSFSYPTKLGWLPDPFFRIHTANIHKDKHGSDSGTYDTEGRFVPQKFEDIFAKYAAGRNYITLGDVFNLHKGQRLIVDPIGWFAAFFEWLATYILLWPEDGRMMKEDIRGIFDGSIFYTIAKRRAAKGSKGN